MKSFATGFKLAAAAMVLAVGAYAAPAAAVTAEFYNALPSDTLRFTLGCGSSTGDCTGKIEALTSEPATYDASGISGALFTLANQGDATELAFINDNTVGGDSFGSLTKDSSHTGESTSFTTDAAYILLNIGKKPNTGLIHNISGGTLELFYTATSGTGSGLSHISTVGTASVVPLPASVLLLLSGLGGLGLLGWRRRAALA